MTDASESLTFIVCLRLDEGGGATGWCNASRGDW
jgi:hypothetical protein